MQERKTAQPKRSTDLLSKLCALGRYAAIFEAPGFTFGNWTEAPQTRPDVITLPFFQIQRCEAQAFTKMAYDRGWVRSFDWPKWMRTKVGRRFITNPATITSAMANQLSKLLTSHIRGERFCNGALNGAFEFRLLIAVARRAQTLHNELVRQRPKQPLGYARRLPSHGHCDDD